METTISFGYWIRRQRKALDLTQQALADKVGYSLAAIKKIESDERKPSRQIAERLAEVLDIPMDQREIFLEVARGLRPVDQLSLVREPASASLPSGTVSFLFTDIENSTKLAQQHADAMPALLTRHHEILHQSIQTHNGYVFQVVGDQFAAAFHSAGDALNAALRAQHLLHNETWSPAPIKVRMGIHTGAAQLQDTSKAFRYLGYATIALTQRIMSAGHGGQILLSDATENLLSGHLPEDVGLLDLGEHKFKNILQPVRVFQVIAPDLQKEFPALRALDVFSNNLPIQLTSFIGREKEIADVIRLLEKTRLVTLTGPGGTGKTRLSIQVANEVLEQYPDGVWMVELEPIFDPTLIPRTTAIAIGLRGEPHRPVIDMLCDYLREKKMLIILDNCEHLIEACAQLADTILHACPHVRMIATSREALAIAGETSYLVPSLTLPDMQHLPRVESLSQYEAIQLFIDRAASAIPTFTLTDENAAAIAQICQRLDGIPLAIELAAGKIRAMSTRQIAGRLDDRFRLLTGGSRTALPRHQTLQAAIDWSYNLLSPAEQIVFRRLSVFVGGWTLEASESVCSDEDTTIKDALKPEDILELLTQLINKSLVTTEEYDGVTRYHFLETIRQYAREKLDESGEANAVQVRHADWFVNFAEQAEPELGGSGQTEWLGQLRREYSNLRAALVWSLENDAGIALRLASALVRFWEMRGHLFGEPIVLLEKVLSTKEAPGQMGARAKVLGWLGNFKYLQADYADAIPVYEKALALYEELNDKNGCANSLYFLGEIHASRGDDAKAHTCYVQARSYFLQSLVVLRGSGDTWREARSLLWLGEIARIDGDYITACSYYNQSLALQRELGDETGIALSLFNLGSVALYQGDYREAARLFQDGLALFQKLGRQRGVVDSLAFLAGLAGAMGQPERAARLFGAAEALHEAHGTRISHVDRIVYDRSVGLIRTQLNDAMIAKLWAEGRAMTMEQAIALATEDESEDSPLPKEGLGLSPDA